MRAKDSIETEVPEKLHFHDGPHVEPLDVRVCLQRRYFRDRAEHRLYSPLGDQAVPVAGPFGRTGGRDRM